MERTVTVDGREVRLRASAALPRMYRMQFRRDIIQDMSAIQKSMKQSAGTGGDVSTSDTGDITDSTLPLETLTLLENMAYLMARHADPAAVPGTVEEWLDGFETFSIYDVMPTVFEMWGQNLQTLSKSKKK